MAAPNIVNTTSIVGISTFIAGISTTAYTVILSNPASSNKVLKLNTLMAVNTSSASLSVFVKIFNQASGVGNSVSLASSISLPPGSSLAVVGKDTPLYLEENRSIGALAAIGAGVTVGSILMDVVASYEDIS